MKSHENQDNQPSSDAELSNLREDNTQNEEEEIGPEFFVFPNPLMAICVLYGLYLTFHAGFSPSTIPTEIPLGSFVKSIGENYHWLMIALTSLAIVLHSGEALYAIKLSKSYNVRPIFVLGWFLNGILFGVFALWPLYFPKFYLKWKNSYFCKFCCCAYPQKKTPRL